MSRRDGVKVTEIGESHFGDYYKVNLTDENGRRAEAIIVAVNSGSGYRPVSLLLPHQLYTEKADQLLKDYAGRELWVYPVFDHQAWTQVDVRKAD